MDFIKHNKIFVILFFSYLILIVSLSFMLIKGDDDVLMNWSSGDKYIENRISYFNGSFNDNRFSIDFSWYVELADSSIERYEIYYDDLLLREGINASSAVLGIKEHNIKTGNNKFDLKVYLKNDHILEKSVYVYVDEVIDFEVSQHIVGSSIVYTLSYIYDERTSVSPPQVYIYNFDYPVSIQYLDAKQVSKEGSYIKMNVQYELDYSNIESGRYDIEVTWDFNDHNFTEKTVSTIDVTGVIYD